MPANAELWADRAQATIAVTTLAWVAVLPLVLVGLGARSGEWSGSGLAANKLAALLANHVAAEAFQAFQALQASILAGLIVGFLGWRALG